MFKKRVVVVFFTAFLTGCGSSSDSSSGAGGTDAASSTASSASAAPAPSTSKQCVDGNFAFSTDSDGKVHFDAYFFPNGTVNYNIQGAPKGTWKLKGNTLSFVGPFGPGFSDVTLNWTVSRTASDCSVLQFRGISPGGAAVTASRT